MAAHDVSHELRGEHGKWTKGGQVLHRLVKEAGTAGKAQRGELKEGHRVKYKTGSVGTVHHIDEKGTPHVIWDRGRGKPVATPPQHLTRIENGANPPVKPPVKAEAEEKAARELVREPEYKTPPQLTQVAHPKSLKIAGSANRGIDDNKKMRREVLRASTIQAQHTPTLVGKTEVTITKAPHGERNTSTLASHTGKENTLHVKPEVLIGSNAEAVRKANVGGWWVPTDAHHNLSDNVLIHEYGHGVHGMLISKGIINTTKIQQFADKPAEHELWNGLADAMGISRPSVKSIPLTMSGPGGKGYETRIVDRMDVGNWLYDNKAAVQKKVSKYGSTNQNEMMAELWTEYKLSSKPRAPAQFFGNWVMSQLQKAGGA
jgi:hypothetical protein